MAVKELEGLVLKMRDQTPRAAAKCWLGEPHTCIILNLLLCMTLEPPTPLQPPYILPVTGVFPF